MEFASFNTLLKKVKNDFNKTIQTKVAEEVKRIEQTVIKEVVYDVYSPKRYKRRNFELGGFINEDSLVEYYDGGVEADYINLWVQNEAEPNTNYPSSVEELDEVIEYGMVDKKKVTKETPPYQAPRPFTDETQKEINESDIVLNVIKSNLSEIYEIEF